MKKKLLTAFLLVICAVALVVGSVLTTMALLTSSANVTNTFTIGEVKITMDEAKVNSDGEVQGDARVDANSYHLVPNKTYVKDPTIHIKSGANDDMYLFVKSTNMIRSAEEGNNGGEALSMRQQMIDNGWVEYVRSGDGVEIVWVYGKRDTTTGKITPTPVNGRTEQVRADGITKVGTPAGDFRLCESFTIDEHANVSLYGAATVTFTAFAIQDDGFKETDHDLTVKTWESIKSSFPYNTGILEPKNPYSDDVNVDAYAPVAGVPGPVEIPINSNANSQ